MKAMLWKELRENLKWAVLAMIGLGLAEFYSLLNGSDASNDQTATLCKSSFLTVTTFGSAAVGIALGLVQILPERRRDQWAMLIYRPVPRSTIFFGKVVAGILLYFLATIPPLLACVWYVVTPGHYGLPFVPQMALPGVADTWAGLMFYFAAVLAGVGRGAWYGTRAFGIPAALLGMVFVSLGYFWLAIALTALMGLALFVAGWGAMATNGALRDQSFPARFCTVTVVLSGAIMLCGFGIILVSMFSARQYGYRYGQYRITVEGKPVLFEYGVGKEAGMTVKDLAGNVITDKKYIGSSSYNYLLNTASVSTSIGDDHRKQRENEGLETDYRNNRRYVLPARGTYDNYTEEWYYLPLERQFVGYYYKSKLRIGAIGENGFQPGYADVAPLPPYRSARDYDVAGFVQFGSTAYHLDFDQRKLTVLFSQPGAEVFGVTPLNSMQDRMLSEDWGAVALLDKLLVIDKTGKIVATLPYHQDVSRWGFINMAVTPDRSRFILEYNPSLSLKPAERQKMPSFLETLDAQGKVLDSYELPPLPEPSIPDSWQDYAEMGWIPPAFVGGYLAYVKIGAMCGSEELADDWNVFFEGKNGWELFGWKTCAFVIGGTSIILALITLLWARRMSFSPARAWKWAVFVLAFNLPGLITFRLAADWPVRVKCPQCGKKRLVEETICPHCHGGWPALKPSGIEIFEGKTAVAQPVSQIVVPRGSFD